MGVERRGDGCATQRGLCGCTLEGRGGRRPWERGRRPTARLSAQMAQRRRGSTSGRGAHLRPVCRVRRGKGESTRGRGGDGADVSLKLTRPGPTPVGRQRVGREGVGRERVGREVGGRPGSLIGGCGGRGGGRGCTCVGGGGVGGGVVGGVVGGSVVSGSVVSGVVRARVMSPRGGVGGRAVPATTGVKTGVKGLLPEREGARRVCDVREQRGERSDQRRQLVSQPLRVAPG